jgi:hypothetical protein
VYNYEKKTRVWKSSKSNKIVQFRTDVSPFVYIHSDVGWMPLGNCPSDPEKAEAFAEKYAKSHKLAETSKEYAESIAGW